MTVIRIQERAGGLDSPNAIVSFDHGSEYPITVRNPFSEEKERLLEWYFEEYLRFPFTKQVAARESATSTSSYGEALFNQIFANREVYAIYKGCVQAGLNTLQVEIAGSPEFHRLHWEALRDPLFPQPLGLQTTIVRKNLKPQKIRATLRPSPTINVLVVTARPFGRQDVGYRTISRPLVDELRRANLPVQVNILRPGTYRALSQHMDEVTNRYGVGYYHVIHFDVHGAVLTYEQVQQGQQANRYLFQARYGRDDLHEFEGHQAFLFLEGEQNSLADTVEAGELANLLLKHHIPIVILNACQSGKQVGANETSLGSRLMEAGIQVVLAMGYSVTVSASEVMMRALYTQLFAGYDLSTAIRQARVELYNNKARRVSFNQLIDLEDWLLPVVYQHWPQHLVTRPFTPEERKAYFERIAASYPEPRTNYGFVGRDIDILQLEKRLLTKRNLVLAQGMGGAGKTTLLQHLGFWWQTTGLVEHVFYFGYDERVWTCQQILVITAQQLLEPEEYHQNFLPLPLSAQQAMIARLLRAKRHLLILDNLESITGSHLAIQHILLSEERTALQHFLASLTGGHTLVLLGSRGSEDWLAPGTFEDNIYELPGLDPEAATLLAERILERHNATKYRDDVNLQRLLGILKGFPLAIEVVLTNLARQTPTQVLEELQAGDVNLDTGDIQKKTESILRCIEYSYSNLSPEAQQLLACLAPFTSVVTLMHWFEKYIGHLQQQPALAKLPFEHLPEVIQEARNWGLVRSDPFNLYLQPTLPYFLRSRLAIEDQTEVRQAIEKAFCDHYDDFGRAGTVSLQSKDPTEREAAQILTQMEYENLVTALNLKLAAETSFLDIYRPLIIYLDTLADSRRGLDLGQYILSRLELYSPDKLAGPLGLDFVGTIDTIAFRQLELKDFASAEASYQKALSLLLENRSLDTKTIRKGSASIYFQLGLISQEQHQLTQAEQYYRKALQINIEYNDSLHEASIYDQLGMIDRGQRQWVQAEQYFSKALQIYTDLNDREEQARVYSNLGKLAQDQCQWVQAEQYFSQALQVYIDFNDYYKQAIIHHQLAHLAQAQNQLDRAEWYYKEALQTLIALNNRHGQANVYQNLGVVSTKLRQWAQARDYFLRALEIFVSYNDNHSSDLALHNLALLWRDSKDTTLPSTVASILHTTPDKAKALFDEVLAGKGDKEEVSSPNAATILQQFEPLLHAIVTVTIKDTARRSEIEATLADLETKGWRLRGAIQHIWAGERDLAVLTEGLDEQDAALVQRLLEILAEEWIKMQLQELAETVEDEIQRSEIEKILTEVETKSQIIRGVVQHIWAGERDLAVLTEGLDEQDAALVQQLFEIFGEAVGEKLLWMIASAIEDESQRGKVEAVLAQMEGERGQLKEVVQRIWTGERDSVVLTEGLDEQHKAFVEELLEYIDEQELLEYIDEQDENF